MAKVLDWQEPPLEELLGPCSRDPEEWDAPVASSRLGSRCSAGGAVGRRRSTQISRPTRVSSLDALPSKVRRLLLSGQQHRRRAQPEHVAVELDDANLVDSHPIRKGG